MTKKKPLEQPFGLDEYAKFLQDQREANTNPETYRKNMLLNNLISIKLAYNQITSENIDDCYKKKYERTRFKMSEFPEDEKIRIMIAPWSDKELPGKIEIKQDVPEDTFIIYSIANAEKAQEIIKIAVKDDYYNNHIIKHISDRDLLKLSAKIKGWIDFLNEKLESLKTDQIIHRIIKPEKVNGLFRDLNYYFDPEDHQNLHRVLSGYIVNRKLVFHGTEKKQLPYVFRVLRDKGILISLNMVQVASWIQNTFEYESNGKKEDFSHRSIENVLHGESDPPKKKDCISLRFTLTD